MKLETGKKQDVMTLSDSDDVQTISSGSDDNKEREKVTTGRERRTRKYSKKPDNHHALLTVFVLVQV